MPDVTVIRKEKSRQVLMCADKPTCEDSQAWSIRAAYNGLRRTALDSGSSP